MWYREYQKNRKAADPIFREKARAASRSYEAKRCAEDSIYRKKKNDRAVAWEKEWRQELRQQLFNIYGRVCACCGEDEIAMLTLGHNNGSRKEDSARIGGKYNGGSHTKKLWELAIKEPNSERYRIECFNCNIGARINNGICPHKSRGNPAADKP